MKRYFLVLSVCLVLGGCGSTGIEADTSPDIEPQPIEEQSTLNAQECRPLSNKSPSALISDYYFRIQSKDYYGAFCHKLTDMSYEDFLELYQETTNIWATRVMATSSKNTYDIYVSYEEKNQDTEYYLVRQQLLGEQIKTLSSKKIFPLEEDDRMVYYLDDHMLLERGEVGAKQYFAENDPRKYHVNFSSGVELQSHFTTGDTISFYHFRFAQKAEGEEDSQGEGWKFSIVPNTQGYKTYQDVYKDYGMCEAGGSFCISQISKHYLLFTDSCGSGAGEPAGCSAMSQIQGALIQLK